MIYKIKNPVVGDKEYEMFMMPLKHHKNIEYTIGVAEVIGGQSNFEDYVRLELFKVYTYIQEQLWTNKSIGELDYLSDIKSACEKITSIYRLEQSPNDKNEKEIELEHFLSVAVDLIAVVNDESIIIRADSKWKDTLGWHSYDVLNHSISEFVYEEDRHKLHEIDMKDKEVIKRTFRMSCQEGGYRWIEWQISYHADKGLAVCTGRDITDSKLRKQEKEQYEQKRQADKIKNEFFSNISHEFRTPINIILASIQLIKNKNEKDEIINREHLAQYIKKIHKNALRLLRLSNNVLDLTEMGIGSDTLELENHNIINVIEETTLSVVEYTKQNAIELIFDTEEEEIIMACDVEKIQRIILNLLSNAVKFTPRKGKIEVNIYRNKDYLVVTVADTGIGIPEERCQSIFERGVQIDTSFRRRSEGSGMGLAVVKGILDICKGSIEVESKVGEGTCFKMKLPIHVIEGKDGQSDVERILKVERCNMEFSDVYGWD